MDIAAWKRSIIQRRSFFITKGGGHWFSLMGTVLPFAIITLCHLNLEHFLHRQPPLEDAQSDSGNFSDGKIDIIGDSVDLLYANLYNPPRQNARVSGRDRTDAQRVCACAVSLCCGLCRPLSSRQDLGR